MATPPKSKVLLTERIGTIKLQVVDAITVARTSEGEDVLLRVNHCLHQPDEERSLLSSFQVRHSGTRIDSTPMQHDDRSLFGIVLDTEKKGRVVIPFSLRGTSAGFMIRTPDDEDLDNLDVFDITSTLTWDPNSLEHAEEEARVQVQKDFTANERMFLTAEMPTDGEVHRVNLSSMWTRSTDALLLPALDEDDTSTDESMGSESAVQKAVNLRISKLKLTKKALNAPDSAIKAIDSAGRKPKVTPERLAQMWGIGIEKAKLTVEATTQSAVRDVSGPLTRRFKTRNALYRRRRFRGTAYTDTMMSGVKSMRGNVCAQVIVTDFHDITVYPLKSKMKAYVGISRYFVERGVPGQLHSDNAREMTEKAAWKKALWDEGGIKATTTEPYSPFQNNAEREIRHLQAQALKQLVKAGASLRFWDDCLEYFAEIRSRTARPDDYRLEGRVPREFIESNTVDISEYVQFPWYSVVWYWDQGSNLQKGERLGRLAGIANNVGQAMCFRIIPIQSRKKHARFYYRSRSTVRAPLPEEVATEEFKAEMKKLDESIAIKVGDPATDVKIETFEGSFLMYENRGKADFQSAISSPDPIEPEAKVPEVDDAPTPEETDEYTNVQVLLPKEEGYQRARITSRKRNAEGELIGKRNNNPLLDTRSYEACFPDGSIVDVAANTVASSLMDNCDEFGNEFRMMRSILDHKTDGTEVPKEDGWIRRKSESSQPRERRKTTKGWFLLVEWVDGTETWEPLSQVKESYPLEVCDYAHGNKIDDEPAFAWWVHQFKKEKKRVLSKVKKRYWKRTHKFGVQLPKSIEEAYRLDEQNGNTRWRDAIEKEQTNNACAFKILEEGENAPRGYKKIRAHMIFDVKMDAGFTRKARFVADGNMIPSPPSMTYASVVSRDSVRICLTLAALNGLNVKCADVQNAYLNAEPKERVYIIAGKEFGRYEGRTVVIIRSLYGLKGSGAAWAAALRQVMRDMNFLPCKADGDVWIRPACDTSFGGERKLGATNDHGEPEGDWYYEYVLIHTDDILACSKCPDAIMEAIGRVYKLKEDKTTKLCWDDPDIYLGTKIRTWRDPEEVSENPDAPVRGYSMSGDHYCQSIVNDVQAKLKKHGRQLNANQKSPCSAGYRPELDTSHELDEHSISDFQEIIGCLRWAIELGRADIAVEVSLLSRHLALPRRGHLDQAYNIVAYLKKHPYSKLVMDATPLRCKERYAKRFKENAEWYEFYGEVREEIPSDAPKPLGKPVELTAFVDADHAGDKLTRRSHTGFIIFLMRAPILWYSKKQATIESSTFGSEIVAMRSCLESVKAIRYKLRMMGVPLDGPAVCWCDNQSVANGASIPEQKLSKKHLGICYHAVREASAAKIWLVGFIEGKDNIADCLTKVLSGTNLEKQVNRWMYRK